MMVARQMTDAWRLSDLLQGIAVLPPAADRKILGLNIDSRKVRAGDLFIACTGTKTHGREYISQAVQNGAQAVLLERAADVVPDEAALQAHYGVPVITVVGLGRLVSTIAGRFYGHPSLQMTLVGVTGTNGKTSCSQFIAQALSHDEPCGVIGTLGNGLFGQLAETGHTTPDPVTLQALLVDFYRAGARQAVMEVSSHGLEQGRVAGLAFDVAVFTNLSREHLDYHGNMAAYGRAKRALFEMPGLQYAVINHDDAYGRELLASLPVGVKAISYGLDLAGRAMIRGGELRLSRQGLAMKVATPWGEGLLRSTLLGRFNASNLLAALAVLLVLDIPLTQALQRLSGVRTVPGRMEAYGGDQHHPLVVVDYAHTPDALQQVLLALREHCKGELWCVFGCGGNRDKGKRPQMGEIAARCADRIIITDDNPRHEDADGIVADILAGMGEFKPAVIRDRAAAIRQAVSAARPEDVVLIAGKGHEDYQLVGDSKLAFSDSAQVQALLRGEP
ncbi:MAG: UDP-N-acetylmuramoyl-L-alanyl-D-glutamate--2,6-diaminopimelate ligase [Gammaproteobacteria bacterium RBG_16_57_12]|nr:MAG: UDP-N-acetylmuramoyl-L-alanyl-D-glutamate--2,6-diaminopimelate ligase [Gammaproteobacteria bacterium RBG_16_57_12]